MNDTYSGATAIYAGMSAPAGLPAWVTAQPVGTWGTVPATNTLSALDPKLDPAINPNFPNNPEWYGTMGFNGLILPWNGFVWDHVNKRLRTGLSGGHGDYGGNDEYGINLNAASPTWFRMRKPSGAVGNLLVTRDGQEATGDYADGQPRAIHTWNKSFYAAGLGLVVAMQGNTSYSAAAGRNRPLIYGDDGLLLEKGADNANGVISSGGGGCYDPLRHCIYFRGSGTEKIQKYDLATKTWSQIGETLPYGRYVALEYIPDHDCLLFVSEHIPNRFAVFDLVTLTYHYPQISGAFSGMSLQGQCKPIFIASGEFAIWDNSANTTQINRLRFTGNPRTATWTVDTYPVDAANSVTPTARASNGTYGRFFADSDLGIMGVINGINQPIYFYRYK